MNQSPKIKSGLRIALAVGFIASALTWIATWMGIVPDPALASQKHRLAVTKTVASAVSCQLRGENRRTILATIEQATEFNEEINSIEIERRGVVWATAETASGNDSSGDVVELELLASGKPWGSMQIGFGKQQGGGNIFPFPLPLVMFVFGAGTLASWVVLSRSFKYLNPSRVVPKRVRSAFDTLAEGLVLVNTDREIAHANVAFEGIVAAPLNKIIGRNLSDFGWHCVDSESDSCFPWEECLREERSITSRIIAFECDSVVRRFMVNTTPVYGENAQCRGAMVSFDDITEMERKNAELRRSRDEVKRQNLRLSFLASYDPLTKCMNRRSFWADYEQLWEECQAEQLNLLMVDIDHFKSINDTYGHSFGDAVLAELGEVLRNVMGERGVVCRYGGEEFCVAVPNANLDQAMSIADELLDAVRAIDIEGKKITASLGLSNRQFKAMDCQHLLDQADQCLYVAKRQGRDQLVVFDPERTTELANSDGSETDSEEMGFGEIPHTTVKGMVSALSFRCPRTADHSMRVAELAVRIGKLLLGDEAVERLEAAALLHDIGKIGLPDSILHKPEKLTGSEWEIMNQQDRMGMQIISSAFECDDIPRIIEAHRSTMHGRVSTVAESMSQPRNSTAISGDIITVCDAFDSMLQEQPWRRAMSLDEALRELIANCPNQFNLDVVKVLKETIEADGLPFSVSQDQTRDRAERTIDAAAMLLDAEEQLNQRREEPTVERQSLS